VIHGILHLAGFDDHRPEDMLQMRRMEKELL
jgi:ssRNA-specific RNase YbeY (16S rRNA maturation enzyme)